MAINPRSLPLYVFATSCASENDPHMRLRLLLHSRTNAAEHRLGYSLRIYDPSVTATSVPSRIACCSHSTPQ
jgi:hypothetical protein